MTTDAPESRLVTLARFVNDLKPLSLEPLATILHADDMEKLHALDDCGWFMRCDDTGRIFCPRFCFSER